MLPLNTVARPHPSGKHCPRRLSDPDRRPNSTWIAEAPASLAPPRPRRPFLHAHEEPLQVPAPRRAADYFRQRPPAQQAQALVLDPPSRALGPPPCSEGVSTSSMLLSGNRSRSPKGFKSSQMQHEVVWQKCLTLWALVEPLLFPISSVLQELGETPHSDKLKFNMLKSVSENTLLRYLTHLLKFLHALRDLGVDWEALRQINVADALLALHKTGDHVTNGIKAVRWSFRVFGLRLPDLYGGLMSGLEHRVLSDRREALPLPIFVLAFCERYLLLEQGEPGLRLFMGALLVAANASLRFSDMQHVLWSSLQAAQDNVRAISFRTKSSRRGMPFGFVSCGFYGDTASYYHSWVCKYLHLLGSEWDAVVSRFGETIPDALFFISSTTEWQPMSYAQALSAFRGVLVLAGMSPGEASSYTLHSLKTCLLAALAQLQVSFRKRGLQGHHRSSSGNGCVLLYSRDDVHGALSLQHMFWEKVRGGWLPLRPQARGGQLPAEQLAIDPQVVTYQSSPAHHRFPVEALAFLSSPVPSPAALPSSSSALDDSKAAASDIDSSSSGSSTSSSVPSGRRERQDRSEAAAEEFIWVQTTSGIIHAAVACHGCDGLVVKRPDSVQVRVKPKCGTIAQQMQVLEVLPSAPRFCRHKACQTVFLT